MRCPFCQGLVSQVIDTRASEDGLMVRRRRRCESCGQKFRTVESVEMSMPQVVKQSGSRVDFSLEKLRRGLARALNKRPVPTAKVDEALHRICAQIALYDAREISSQKIGALVMAELKRLDKVAYIRFASVYLSFQDVSEFSEMISAMQDENNNN